MAKTETIVARRKAAKASSYVQNVLLGPEEYSKSEIRQLKTQVDLISAQLNKILKRG